MLPERLAHASQQLLFLLSEPLLAQRASRHAEPPEHFHRVLERGDEPFFEGGDQHSVGYGLGRHRWRLLAGWRCAKLFRDRSAMQQQLSRLLEQEYGSVAPLSGLTR